MREIKFRAWDKKNRKMSASFGFDGFGGDGGYGFVEDCTGGTVDVVDTESNPKGILFNPDCFDIMQYTGLKDKNGKEIYEGDIVRNEQAWCIGDEWPVGEIDFVEWMFVWDRGWTGSFQHSIGVSNESIEKYGYDDIARYLEVIGNIYENPELLTKE